MFPTFWQQSGKNPFLFHPRSIKKSFSCFGLEELDRPAQSPDLNTIQLRARSYHPASVLDLRLKGNKSLEHLSAEERGRNVFMHLVLEWGVYRPHEYFWLYSTRGSCRIVRASLDRTGFHPSLSLRRAEILQNPCLQISNPGLYLQEKTVFLR